MFDETGQHDIDAFLLAIREMCIDIGSDALCNERPRGFAIPEKRLTVLIQ